MNGQAGLAPWLGRMINDLTEGGAVTRFELCHCVEGEPAEKLEYFKCLVDSPRVPDELHREIINVAEADTASRTSSGAQRYIVQAFRGDPSQHDAQFSFLVHSRNTRGRFGDESEPPTEKGVLTYSMRHAEVAYRLLATGTDALVGKLSREIEREHALRLKAEETSVGLMAECQALLDRSSERRLAEARALMQQQRIDQVLGSLVPLVPLLVERLAGIATAPKQFEDKPPMLDQQLQELFRSLTQGELNGMIDALQGPNQIVFGELHSQFVSTTSTIGSRNRAMQMFLKQLTEPEALGLFAALSPGAHRAQMMAIYTQFRKLDAAEQASKPEVLRS